MKVKIANRIFKSSSAILLCCALFFCFSQVKAQVNYVLNPSLELLDSACIQNDMPIKHVPHWNCIDSSGYWTNSPWSVNTCDICCNQSAAPLNGRFNHYPRTGKGMVYNEAVLPGAGTNYRDYLQGHLYKPLLAGKTYCVCFYVCQTQQAYYSVSNIGAYLDDGNIDTAIHTHDVAQTQYTPQVMESALVKDTLHWTKVEGSFVANGTEKFITIGIYTDDAHTNKAIYNINSLIGQEGCYLVDDVSVIESDTKAYAWGSDTLHKGYLDSIFIGRDETIPGIEWYRDGVLIDTLHAGIWIKDDTLGTYHTYILAQTLCGVTTYDTVVVSVESVSSGVTSPGLSKGEVTVWPNPATSVLHVYAQSDMYVSILGVDGKVLMQDCFVPSRSGGTNGIKIDKLAPGIYFLQIRDGEGNKEVRKIVKQ